MSSDDTLGNLDDPRDGKVVRGFVQFSGWAFSRAGESVEIELLVDQKPVATTIHRLPRVDVAAAFADAEASRRPGFVAGINTLVYENGGHTVTCIARCGGRSVVIGTAEFRVENIASSSFYRTVYMDADPRRQQKKLQYLLEVLACTDCGGHVVAGDENHLTCSACHARYPVVDGTPIMISGEPEYPFDESLLDSPPSNNPYPDELVATLEEIRSTGGLALDLGSGRRQFGADRLIQVEICNYPFTDVVNQSETLPFRDESFDFVLSLAVTEHVKRPWILAEEIQRVTKKGGGVFVDSAFLQPVHGYPNHYYNMTSSALRELFGDLEIRSLEPAPYQHPWFSVSWILNSALADLPSEERAIITSMTVETFLAELLKYTGGQLSELHRVHLPPHRLAELAAGFTLQGRKKG